MCYAYIRALKDKKAGRVAQAMYDFVVEYGAPKSVISDNGKEFFKFHKEIVKIYDLAHHIVIAFRISSSGRIESNLISECPTIYVIFALLELILVIQQWIMTL